MKKKNKLILLFVLFSFNLSLANENNKSLNSGTNGDQPKNLLNNDNKGGNVVFDPLSLSSEGEVKLLQDLKKRRDEIDRREKTVNQESVRLFTIKKKVEQDILMLTKLKKELKEILGVFEIQKDKKIEGMIKVFDSMKPKQAAAIMNKLDINLAKNIAQKMKKQQSAKILALMNVEKAKEITTAIFKDFS
jgi:flagellar motility protein MotE (MotC chaperone)